MGLGNPAVIAGMLPGISGILDVEKKRRCIGRLHGVSITGTHVLWCVLLQAVNHEGSVVEYTIARRHAQYYQVSDSPPRYRE